MKRILIPLLVLIPVLALAYIPSSSFIFERVAGLHGKGVYKMLMSVQFAENGETHTVKESWIVVDGGEIKVSVTGDGFQLTHLLKRGRIYWIEENGQEHVSEVPSDYFMPALLMRSPMELKKFFARWGVLPPEALKEKRLPKESKDIVVATEPFVKLGRVNGAVQYEYGNPDGPSLWIEQDHFFITKMRAPSGAEFLGQNYIIYSRGLAFPKIQTVTFNGKKADIRVTGLSGTAYSNDIKKQMEPSWMRDHTAERTIWPTHSLSSTIQEFYKHFR